MLFVNCGSVGKPKDGDPRGSFAVLHTADDGVRMTIERVEYEVDPVAVEMRSVGLPAELAEQLRLAA